MKFSREELLNVLVDEDNNNENLLFHYTKLSSALKIILSKTLLLGSLKTMNDPLEFVNPTLKNVGTVNCDKEMLDNIDFMLEQSLKNRNKKIHIASFSSDCNCHQDKYKNLLNKGWARSRMWAQYADNHNGVCLIFDKESLISVGKKKYAEKFRYDFIKYSNNLSPLKSALEVDPDRKDFFRQDFLNYYTSNDRENFLFQKCEDFRDEQEFRIVVINEEKDMNERRMLNIENSLVGIIFGKRTDPVVYTNLSKILEINSYIIDWEFGMPYVY